MSKEAAPLLFPEATEGFDGIVIAMDWVVMPSGRLYKAFAGKVQVLSAEAAVGFTPTGHNSGDIGGCYLDGLPGPGGPLGGYFGVRGECGYAGGALTDRAVGWVR